jgi:hypothetical protein
MVKMSSTIHGLALSVLTVYLSTAASRRVGVGCGCHRGRHPELAAVPDLELDWLAPVQTLPGGVRDHAGAEGGGILLATAGSRARI